MRSRDEEQDDRLPWVPMAVAATASAALTATLFGVQATAVLPRSPSAAAAVEASSGTLDLRLGSEGAGFDQSVGGLAPGDVVHRYVVLRNVGTLAGRGLSLSARATPPGALTADGLRTRAVRAAVSACLSGAWRSDRGTCSGRPVLVLPPVPLGDLGTAHDLRLADLDAGGSLSLRVTLALPDQDEVVRNGRTPQQSIQGARTAVSWTFRQQQAVQPG